jgi:hypothetical protein
MTYEDIRKMGGEILFLDTTDAARMMADGKLDAISSMSAVDYPPYLELSMTLPVRLIGQDPQKINDLGKKHPGYIPLEFPPDRYKGQDQAVTVAGGLSGMAAHVNFPDDVVYGVAKCLYTHRKEIEAAPPAYGFRFEKDQEFVKGIPIPLHPGAERFWAEKGVVKKTLDCCY